MEFDHVHHIQKAYRRLVDCMSKPGTINSLADISPLFNIEFPCNKSLMVLAYMLLDIEVSFYISSNISQTLSKYVTQLTYSKPSGVEDADYIFVMQDDKKNHLGQIIKSCKAGSLIDPHASATLIIEAKKVSNEKMYLLKGPGIKNEKTVAIYLNEENWKSLREAKNKEYPLGIDIIFVDQQHNLLALPRTTILSEI